MRRCARIAGRTGVGTACTGDARVRTMYVIIVIDLVELHPIQWGFAVITPFGRPGDVQVADSRLQEHVGAAFSGGKK